ncbi:MAG: hypothetical protein EVA34_01785 [Erythrobacter sp.]|nr:MAG: hypothetical protein EVA34_01785 [Erythrobacter sp.]
MTSISHDNESQRAKDFEHFKSIKINERKALVAQVTRFWDLVSGLEGADDEPSSAETEGGGGKDFLPE